MNRRFLSLILCMTFILSLFPLLPTGVFADDNKCGDNLTWSIDGDTLIIEGSGAMYDYDYSSATEDIDVPPWSSQRANIDFLSISDDVTHIGDYSFYGFTKIFKPTLPSKLETIGRYAFRECSGLYQVKFGSSLTEICDGAFYKCSTLNNINLPENLTSLGNFVFTECTSLSVLKLNSGLKTIGQRAFDGCTKLAGLTIPETVKSIAAKAFYNCKNLESIDFSNAATTIGDQAFTLCSSLANISNMTAVKSIGTQAFYGCTKLESVTIPASVSSIGAAAFAACLSLSEINVDPENAKYTSVNGSLFDKDVTVLHQYALGKKAGVYVIPESVDTISALAFAYCNLKSLGMGKNVTTIGQDILSHSKALAYYEGSEDDLAKISVHEKNDDLIANLIYETPVYGAISEVTTDNGTVTVTAEYAFGKNIDCLAYAGIYDENNVLIKTVKANKAEGEFTFNDTEILSGYTVRLFYWNNETDLKPIGITTSLKI